MIELLIATAITLTLAAGVLAMLHPAHGAFDTSLETADMQQRVRIAADALTRDLATAGAGAYLAGRVGPLIHAFAPVRPFRENVDPAGTFRADAITTISVPSTAAQTTLAADLASSDLTLQAVAQPGCFPRINLCGFAPGMTVLVYDDAGSVDVFTVVAVADATAQLTLSARPGSVHANYRRGSNVVEARVHSYYLKADAASQTFQLRHGDGSAGNDAPLVDHVVGLAFTYDAEPQPPRLTATGETSYGPTPLDSGTTTTAYPAGENCAFRIDEVSGLPVSRLPPLAAGSALTPLAAAQLQDGPWCPDDTSANRWDADLLRIRSIGVSIRVEAALAALRGPAGALFANAGSARTLLRWAPDQELRFRVSPRNMNLERE